MSAGAVAISRRRDGWRPARFVSVGLMGFVLQTAALHVLTAWANLSYLPATVLAVEIAILHNFLWHERWTWRSRTQGAPTRLARLARFNGLSGVVSIVGNVGLTGLLVEVGDLPLLLANLTAVVSLSLVNYAWLDGWIFAVSASTRPVATEAAQAWRPRAPQAAGLRGTRRPVSASPAALVRRHAPWVGAALTVAAVLADTRADAAEPSPATLVAWHRYVAQVEARIARDLDRPSRFLALDTLPASQHRLAQVSLRRGEVLTANVADQAGADEAVDVPDGLVHHWRGTIFIPGATVDQVMRGVTDPTGAHAHRQDDVVEARVLERTPQGLRIFLQLQRRSIVTVSYNTEHAVQYRVHDRQRASSRSVATRIREVVDLGTPTERECPAGEDRGFLWGLNSYWRYQAAPGGVIVELESLTLSRGLPWGLQTVVRPLIDRVARESLTRTLTSMRARFDPGATARATPSGDAAHPLSANASEEERERRVLLRGGVAALAQHEDHRTGGGQRDLPERDAEQRQVREAQREHRRHQQAPTDDLQVHVG